jgi:hypothetical protein
VPPICAADGRPARSDTAMQIWLFRVSCIGPLGGSSPSAREAGAGPAPDEATDIARDLTEVFAALIPQTTPPLH